VQYSSSHSLLKSWPLTKLLCAWQGDDAYPLHIRSVAFNGDSAIGSDSTDPCAANTISVTVAATGPIFKACVTQITIAGLLNTATDDTQSLELTGPAVVNGLFQGSGSWTQSSGDLVVTLAADIIKGCDLHVFQFALQNRPASSDGVQTVSISTDASAILPAQSMNVAGNFLNVESISFNTKAIASNSNDPCAVRGGPSACISAMLAHRAQSASAP